MQWVCYVVGGVVLVVGFGVLGFWFVTDPAKAQPLARPTHGAPLVQKHEAGRSGLLFVMTYGNGGGCTFKVVARTRSGALVDFILAAASRATTGGGSAAAVQPRPSRAALMIAGALGVELEELLLDRGGTGLPRKLVYLEQIRCRLRASPVRLAPSLLPFLFVSRADRSGSGARLRHLAAGMWPRKGGAAGREHAARCRGMPTAVVYEQRAHALPWSASSDNAAAGRLADASLQTAAAAIDFELVYASAAAADGVLLPPPRTAAVVARGSALIAVAGAVPEDDALLAQVRCNRRQDLIVPPGVVGRVVGCKGLDARDAQRRSGWRGGHDARPAPVRAHELEALGCRGRPRLLRDELR